MELGVLAEPGILHQLEQMLPPTGADYADLAKQAYDDFWGDPSVDNERLANGVAIWLINRPDCHALRPGIRLLQRLSDAGVRPAMYNLAQHMLTGVGIQKAPEKACALLETILAMEKTDTALIAQTQTSLAHCCLKGLGRPADIEQAVLLYSSAAELGVAEAAYHAGLIFHGRVLEWLQAPDLDRAAYFYQLGLECGGDAARTNLGLLHACEAIQFADRAYGERLLRMSAAAGDAVAADALRRLVHVPPRYKRYSRRLAPHVVRRRGPVSVSRFTLLRPQARS